MYPYSTGEEAEIRVDIKRDLRRRGILGWDNEDSTEKLSSLLPYYHISDKNRAFSFLQILRLGYKSLRDIQKDYPKAYEFNERYVVWFQYCKAGTWRFDTEEEAKGYAILNKYHKPVLYDMQTDNPITIGY